MDSEKHWIDDRDEIRLFGRVKPDRRHAATRQESLSRDRSPAVKRSQEH